MNSKEREKVCTVFTELEFGGICFEGFMSKINGKKFIPLTGLPENPPGCRRTAESWGGFYRFTYFAYILLGLEKPTEIH